MFVFITESFVLELCGLFLNIQSVIYMGCVNSLEHVNITKQHSGEYNTNRSCHLKFAQ